MISVFPGVFGGSVTGGLVIRAPDADVKWAVMMIAMGLFEELCREKVNGRYIWLYPGD